MRIGFNPNKDKAQEGNVFFHQVIIPVYIPNQIGYFKDSFQILKYCLESLFKTIHSKTFITVVNNGSCEEVKNYLQDLFQQNRINEIIHTNNIGYVNAMIKGMAGHQFSIVTTADADVIFLNDWQKACYEVFEAFPKTGAICPSPSTKVLKFYNSSFFWDNFFSKNVCFTKVLDPKPLKAFAISIGNPSFYNNYQLEYKMVIKNNNVTATVGAGHYIVTYRGSVFNELKEKYSVFKLGGGSDDVMDKPVSGQGYWRLATDKNYAFHMGNTVEDWMSDIVNGLEDSQEFVLEPIFKKNKVRKFYIGIKEIFFSKFLVRRPIWPFFLRYKGLKSDAAKEY